MTDPIRPLPAGCTLANIPGAPGAVRLQGFPPDSYYSKLALGIEEVQKCFPEDSEEFQFLKANIAYNNVWARVYDSFQGLAFLPVILHNGVSWVDASAAAIPDTSARSSIKPRVGTPDWGATVAGCIAYFASQPEPTTGAPFAHPG
jgi:hypothetical protein